MATEQFPEGKRLWLAVCSARNIEPQRAALEWDDWEEGFMTKGEWQRAAEAFAHDGVTVPGHQVIPPSDADGAAKAEQ
jgi:hypothetical protein